MAIFSNIVQGEWGDPYGGLLDEQDRRNGLKQGLQGFGAAALGQGYSRVPQSGFEGIGQGIANFQQARDKALRQSLEMKLLNRQMGREDVKDARDTERFGMEKQNFDLAKSKAERDARRDDANFNETDRVRQAQSNLAKVLAARAAAGDRNPSAHPDVISALAQVDGLKGMGALQQEQPLPPAVEAQRIRMAQDTHRSRLLTPEEEAQQVRLFQAKSGDKPLTNDQALAAGFHLRMNKADEIINKFSKAGAQGRGVNAVLGNLPVVGNMIRSEDNQQIRQAQEDWVRAKLRKESGAAIGLKEMDDEIKTYFPQPGDGDAVIKQKAAARRTALDAMIYASGRAQTGMAPATDGESVAPPADQGALRPDDAALVKKYLWRGRSPGEAPMVPIR